MTGEAPVLVLAAVLGLVLGSYSVTAGLRLSRHEGTSLGRSHCDACGRTLGFAETTPIAGFLLSAGRCRTCREPIDRAHLLGEVGGLIVLVSSVAVGAPARIFSLVVVGLALLASATVDWKVGRLPNALTVIIAVAGLALAILSSWTSALIGLIAATLAFAVLQGLRLARAHLGRDPGLGFGDVKLVSALALWLGLATPWMVAIAAVIGLSIQALRPGGRPPRMAFGPALAVAAWVVGISTELGWWPTTA